MRSECVTIRKGSELQKRVIYPGSIYPTNFRELESNQYGGFCIVSGEIPEGNLTVEYIPMKIKDVLRIPIDSSNKSIQKVKEIIE